MDRPKALKVLKQAQEAREQLAKNQLVLLKIHSFRRVRKCK